MPRTRLIKPDFFKDEDLATLPFEARLLFAALWCYADRKGKLEDRPKYLKSEIFPYNNVNIDKLLTLLNNPKIHDRPEKQFIIRYSINGRNYIEIPEFLKHQSCHYTEKDSFIPDRDKVVTVTDSLSNGMITPPNEMMIYSNSNSNRNSNLEEGGVGGEGFDLFWKSYPKKKSKGYAEKVWKRLRPSKDLQETIMGKLEEAKKSKDWQKDNGQYIPHPSTWLNGKGWEDEYAPEFKTNIPSRNCEDLTKCPTCRTYCGRAGYLNNL